MTDRRFRFGVVAAATESAQQWHKTVEWVENAGFSSLLTPDAFTVSAPFQSLASAAMVTSTLKLGTFVLAAPLRTPAGIAWEAASLDRLSGGRLELGLGAGRPAAEAEAHMLGVPFGTPGERVERLAGTIRGVRALLSAATAHAEAKPGQAMASDGGLVPAQRPMPPILVAGAGRKMMALAAAEADIVSLAQNDEQRLGELVGLLREHAGDRFDDIELNMNVFAIGDAVAPWMTSAFGVDPAQAKDNRDTRVLNGDTDTIVDVLRRRRDEFGVSYVMVNSFAMEKMAPVVERLAGT